MLVTQLDQIIEVNPWSTSPAAQYLLAWEQQQLDACVADLFGFHALQLGWPMVDGLRANRMPHRWLAVEEQTPAPPAAEVTARAAALHCHFNALPFKTASIDLVVLPHTLEQHPDPHGALAEVERVLVPQGRVVVLGFNPYSLWGAAHGLAGWRHWLGLARGGRTPLVPTGTEPIGHHRLRDWLRLLNFEIEGGRFGCYRPPLHSARWLDRTAWLERTGQHWWPVFGAAYVLVAVKRVRGMRLVGLAKRERVAGRGSKVVVANREQDAGALRWGVERLRQARADGALGTHGPHEVVGAVGAVGASVTGTTDKATEHP
jgi:SAM-dependent methyltransferase